MATGAVAGAAALALYYYVKGRRAEQGPAVPVPVEACRTVEHAPNTWVEALYYFKEVLRYMYTETFGRWHTVDLFVGLAYLSQKEQSQHPAADIARKGRVRNLRGSVQDCQSLKAELLEIRQYMLYCQGLKHKKAEMQVRFWIEKAGLDPSQILVQQGKSGLFRPAYVLIRDDAQKRVVLCIRGTQSLKDLFTSLTGATKPHHAVTEEGVTLGYSHLGMLAAARWLQRHVTPALKQALSEAGPEYKARIIGHSMGAGTAVLLTMMLRDLETSLSDLQCVAIACPACMTLELANSCRGFVTTVVNGTDIVPTFCAATVDALREDITASSWFSEFQQDLRASVVSAVQGGWRGLGTASDWTARNILTPAAFPLSACYTRTAATCGPAMFPQGGPAVVQGGAGMQGGEVVEVAVQEVVMQRGASGVTQGTAADELVVGVGQRFAASSATSADGRISFHGGTAQLPGSATSLAAAVELLQGTSSSPDNATPVTAGQQQFEFDLTLDGDDPFHGAALRRRPWPWGQSPPAGSATAQGNGHSSETNDPESDSMESRGLLKPGPPTRPTNTLGGFFSSLGAWGWGSGGGGGAGEAASHQDALAASTTDLPVNTTAAPGATGGHVGMSNSNSTTSNSLTTPLLDAEQCATATAPPSRTGNPPLISQVKSFGNAFMGKAGQSTAAGGRAVQQAAQGLSGWFATGGGLLQACINPQRGGRRQQPVVSGGGDEEEELLGDTDFVGGLAGGEVTGDGQGGEEQAAVARRQQLQAGISAVVAAVTNDAGGWDEPGSGGQEDRVRMAELEAEQALWEAQAGRQASASSPGDLRAPTRVPGAPQMSTPGRPLSRLSSEAVTPSPQQRQKRGTNPSIVEINVDGFMMAAPTTPDYVGERGGPGPGGSGAAGRPTHRRLYPAGRILHLMPASALYSQDSSDSESSSSDDGDDTSSADDDDGDGDDGDDTGSYTSSSSSASTSHQRGAQHGGRAGGAGGGGASGQPGAAGAAGPSWVLLDVDDPTAYGRVKLCKTMVMDHFVSAYLVALDSIMLQLNTHLETAEGNPSGASQALQHRVM